MIKKTKCVFCGSSAFGPGCPFAPHKVHFHAGDSKRCCFCGSLAHGPGCPFNPHSKIHVHGVEFNSMVRETIDTGITMGYLMSSLSTPITEMAAYKLGIINEQGKKIKEPVTAEELNSYGALEKYTIGLKQSLGNNLETLHNAVDVHLESFITTEDYSKICECTINLKEEFENVGKAFNNIVTSAYNAGLSKATIEKLIIDSILEK